MKFSTAMWLLAIFVIVASVAIKIEEWYFPKKGTHYMVHVDLIDVRPIDEVVKDYEINSEPVNVQIPESLGNV